MLEKRDTLALAGPYDLATILLGLVMTLAACSDGGGDERADSVSDSGQCFQTSIQNCGPGPWDPFGLALSLAWSTGQCTKEVLCTTDPVVTDFDAGIVTDDFVERTWTTSSAVESEPNNSPSEATPFVIQASTGILITGSVNDATDTADYIALSFGPNASTSGYLIYLCRTPTDCLQPWYEGDEIYIDLLDQNQLIVQSTSVTQVNYINFQASPGVLHFIGVRASDTLGEDFNYKLVVTD